MAHDKNSWWIPVGSFVLALCLALVAGPASRALAIRTRQAATGCTAACDIGARSTVSSNLPSNGTVQGLNGGKNRGSLDATGGSGYSMTIFASGKGVAGPIHAEYDNEIFGSTDLSTSTVVITQPIKLSVVLTPTPANAALGQAVAVLDHDLKTRINGIKEKDSKLLIILANGLVRGGRKNIPPGATGVKANGVGGTQIVVPDIAKTSTFIGDCVAFSGLATVKGRMDCDVLLDPPAGSTIDTEGTAEDLECSLE